MNPIVHAELSWLTAQGLAARRDRLLVVAAGIAPDVDGLSLLAGTDAYGKYHHLLTHGYVAAIVTTAICTAFARRRLAVALLSAAAFHLHLLCDLAGSGIGWPIFYYWPSSDATWSWSHGWELASWQNGVIGLIVTLACFACALRWRRTFVEVFSRRVDFAVVQTVRARFLGTP